MPDPDLDWLPVAQLLRPQGRRGELLADPLTSLEEIFTAGRQLFLAPARSVTLESHFFPTGRNAGRIVLKLSAANSISEAETLAGQTLSIPAAEAPALAPDTFYVRDLIGCTLINGDTPAGTITAVEFPTSAAGQRLEDAAPLLVLDNESLIPFVRAWLVAVDTAAKRVTMHLPEGLLE